MYNVTYTSLPVLVMAIFDQVESTFRRDRPTVHVHRSSVFLHRFLTLSKLFCVSPHFENAPTFCCFTARRSLLLIVLDQHRPRSDLRGIRGRGPRHPTKRGPPQASYFFFISRSWYISDNSIHWFLILIIIWLLRYQYPVMHFLNPKAFTVSNPVTFRK